MTDVIGVPEIEKIGKASRHAAVGSALGALIVIGSLVLSSLQLRSSHRQLDSLQTKIKEAKEELRQKQKEIGEAELKLRVYNDTLNRLATNPQLAKETAQAFKQAIQSNPTAAAVIPRVYIQIGNESQRDRAKAIASQLRARGYAVPGIENVGSKAPSQTVLKYFRRSDEQGPDLRDILSVLGGMGVNVAPQFSGENAPAIRPRQYEIWFGSDF